MAGASRRLAAPDDHILEIRTGTVAHSYGGQQAAAKLLQQPLSATAQTCVDQISEVCRRLDKKGQGLVSVSAYELALKAAGSPLQGDTAGQRLQCLLEALGECVQLEGAATTRAGGTSVPRVGYVAAENRLRAALASTLFGEEKENVFATEASSRQGHRKGSSKMETRAFKTAMKAVAAAEKVSAAVEQDALASTVGGRKPSPTGGSTEKVALNATVAQGVFAGKDYEHVQAVAAAALEDNARLRAALRIANTKSASQSRSRVLGGGGLKLGLWDGGDEREVLLDAQVALCEGREQAVESRERQVSVREAEAGRQLAEVEAMRAQLQLQEKAVDKRQRCLEDQLAVLALQEQEGSLERVPRSALQLVAAAHGEHARARADQERARLLVDVQGKYSALLEAEAGLRAKLEHLEQCLDREQEKNAVLRAMVEESAAAADAIAVARALRVVESERQQYYATLLRVEAVCEHLGSVDPCPCGSLHSILAALRAGVEGNAAGSEQW